MEENEFDINKAIIQKHKMIDRFLELNNDLRKLDRNLLLLMPTPDLIEIGKAMIQPSKLLKELRKKHPSYGKALDEK